ncbi:hypothetical protein BOVA115_5347 [Bacteroides ovatus]|nr:hypothetical protein BOVA115_5347 [Bacteroides ovatus]
MYEFGIMAYDVAVIRCIVVAIERNMSCPWLIEKTQILKKTQNILYPRLNIVSLQPKEFNGYANHGRMLHSVYF